MHECVNSAVCGHYSDVDVYFADGECKDMCSACAWAVPREQVEQVVPQHGSDNVNIKIDQDPPKGEFLRL